MGFVVSDLFGLFAERECEVPRTRGGFEFRRLVVLFGHASLLRVPTCEALTLELVLLESSAACTFGE